jgi:hypothetical protein
MKLRYGNYREQNCNCTYDNYREQRTKFEIYIFIILEFVYGKTYAALVWLTIFHSGVPLHM